MGGAGGLQIGENRASHQVQCSDQSESGLFCPILNYLGIPQPVLKNQPRCQWPHHKGAAWLPHSQASLEPEPLNSRPYVLITTLFGGVTLMAGGAGQISHINIDKFDCKSEEIREETL